MRSGMRRASEAARFGTRTRSTPFASEAERSDDGATPPSWKRRRDAAALEATAPQPLRGSP
ncbi:hypothetical protein BE08_44900 [Sorangium cellulosum]|uniref:Uncharacterized protein n=1 Tax=Sorangium cellulosum TaxID=56 RepID=A0A150PB89_SORCE|nr:hypothetical protein BE08_44900 [Sorangium cellulosum]